MSHRIFYAKCIPRYLPGQSSCFLLLIISYAFFAKEVENKVIHEIKEGKWKTSQKLDGKRKFYLWKELCVCVCVCVCTQSRLILCNPMDYSPPGSSVHGILQARILAWVTCAPPEDLLNPGIEPMSPALQADSLHTYLPRKSQKNSRLWYIA